MDQIVSTSILMTIKHTLRGIVEKEILFERQNHVVSIRNAQIVLLTATMHTEKGMDGV